MKVFTNVVKTMKQQKNQQMINVVNSPSMGVAPTDKFLDLISLEVIVVVNHLNLVVATIQKLLNNQKMTIV